MQLSIPASINLSVREILPIYSDSRCSVSTGCHRTINMLKHADEIPTGHKLGFQEELWPNNR